MQTSVIFYVENSVFDDRLDMKISYMNRVSCCLHNSMFSIACHHAKCCNNAKCYKLQHFALNVESYKIEISTQNVVNF